MPFVLPLRVYYEDTDAAGVVYYANYLRFLERARTEWLRSLGYEQQRLAREMNLGFVVRSLSCEYLKPARLDQMLNVVSEIGSLGRAQLVFAQRVEAGPDAGAEVLLTASVRVAVVCATSVKPAAMPRQMHDTFKKLLATGESQTA